MRCLGRLQHQPDHVARAPRLGARALATTAPARLIRDHIPYAPQLFGNDLLPNCTAVAIANSAIGVAALGGGGCVIDPPNVDAFYAATINVPVADIARTDGALLLDALARQSRVGLPTGHQALLCGPFAAIKPGNLNLLRVAMTFAGLPILGVSLSLSDQAPGVWDTDPPASAGDPTPGSWGMHALVAWDYTGLADDDVVRLATWGTLQAATWRWLRARLDEAYVAVWRPLMPASGRNWAGLDYDALAADVASWA